MSQPRPRISVHRLLAFQLSLLPALLAAVFAPTVAHAAPGDLDPSFGNGGKVTSDFPRGSDSIHAVAIDSRGRIVAAGGQGRRSGDSGFELARYTRNTGSLDHSFSGNGYFKTDFGGIPSRATSVAIDSRGRIVAAGERCGD
jgi:hypothetical protein